MLRSAPVSSTKAGPARPSIVRPIAGTSSSKVTTSAWACAGGVNVAGDNAWSSCDAAAGLHYQEDTGTDTWQAQLPKEWVLTSLELSTASGTILGTAGFNDAPPDAESWSVSWQSGVIGTTFQDSIVWGIFISSQTVDITEASYAMTLYASGPAGTMPP